MNKIPVAKVLETWVYPVKGMQGISMDEISLRSISVVGDRRVAFADTESKGSNTLVDTVKFPGLLKYSTRFDDSSNPKESPIIIKTPEGQEYDVNDPIILKRISDESKRKLAILRMGRGAYHSMPVSLMSLGSIKQTEIQAACEIDKRVFRQNVYIETNTGIAYEEDKWLGKWLVFGDYDDSAEVVAIKLDPRCATVNMHPETSETNPAILKAIVKNHNNTLGIYCTITGEGKIRKNSNVYIAIEIGEH